MFPVTVSNWDLWTLYHKVTFDGANRIIRVNDGVTELDIKIDIYSDWKEWVYAFDDNAVWLPAIRSIGGDPTVAGQTAGDIYFLQNGWKLYIDLTKVKVTGVLFSDDYDSAYYDYNGNIQYPAQVSSLVSGISATSGGSTPQEIWNYQTRELTQEVASDAPSVSAIATAVWGYITRTLTAGAGTSPQEIWEYANRSLTTDAAPSVSEIWSHSSRTLTENVTISDSSIATAVWTASSRTITRNLDLTGPEIATIVWTASNRTLTTDPAPTTAEISAAIWSASARELTASLDPTAIEIASLVWSLSGRELTATLDPSTSAIVAATWNYNVRELTASLDPTAVQIANAVWSASTKETTNAITVSDITQSVWSASSRTLTEGATPEALATAVWTASSRTITENPGITGSEVATVVWTASNRTLTTDEAPSASTVAATTWQYATRTLTEEAAAPSASAVATAVWSSTSRTLTDPGLTAQQVWQYATRTLTSEEVAPSASAVASAVWTAAQRTITSDETISASTISAEVWSAISRTLTDPTPTAQDIWEYASRTLTSNPGITTADVANAVWNAVYDSYDTDSTMGHLLNYTKQLEKAIWVNTEEAANGNGSQENPYNNITSAIDRAEEDNIRKIYLIGNITLTRNFKNFYLIGIGVPEVDLNGQDVKNSHFIEVALKGSFVNGSNIVIRDSVLLDGAYLDGFIENSALGGDLICNPNTAVFMKDCASAIPGTNRPTISMNTGTPTQLSVRGYNGGLTIRDCDSAGDRVTVELAAGSLTFDATCTAGIMVARGLGKFVDETNGATVINETVNQELITPIAESVSALQTTANTINTNVLTVDGKVDVIDTNVDEIEAKVLELWKLAGLDAANVASITDTSITVGGITITIGNPDNNTTTLTRL